MTFDRGALTGALLDHLRLGGLLIGDHAAPKEGGWSKGQPDVGTFLAYSVLSSGAVSVTPNSLDPSRYDHRATYTLRTYGALRHQADEIAMAAREAFSNCPRQSVGKYKASLFWCSQIGAVERINSNDPAQWATTDTFQVECYA